MEYEMKGAEEEPPEGHRSRTGNCEDPVRPRERWEILQGFLLLLTQLPFCICWEDAQREFAECGL